MIEALECRPYGTHIDEEPGPSAEALGQDFSRLRRCITGLSVTRHNPAISCPAPVRRNASRTPRATPDYGARLLDAVDLGENGGRFVFQQGALYRVICLAQLASLVLEAEVAQILVGRFFAFLQIHLAGLLFASFHIAWLIENVEEQERRKQRTAKHGKRGFLSGSGRDNQAIHQ